MSKWLSIFVIFIAFLMAACISSPFTYYKYTFNPCQEVPKRIIGVYVDARFSANDKIAIDEAIGQWNFALNGNEKLIVVDYKFDLELDELSKIMKTDSMMILDIQSDNPLIETVHHGKGKNVAGWTTVGGIGHKIFVVRDRVYGGGQLEMLIMHEIGHFLGAEHVDAYSIMYYSIGNHMAPCIDFRTIKQVARFQLIDLNTINYCMAD